MIMSKNKFPPKYRKKQKEENGPIYIFGLHSVRAALDNPHRTKLRLKATPNALARLEDSGAVANVKIEQATPRELDGLLGSDAVHQGVALEVEPIDRLGVDAIKGAKLILALDQITDPHNVGAILRTASAFGADAVITTARYAPRETGVLAKSASGALDLIPFIEVKNLSAALETLKSGGMNVLGFDSEAPTPLTPGLKFDRVTLVLGAEGKGLRHRTREVCDNMVRLEMSGPIKSLNVSNAAAIALYALTVPAQ